MDNNEFNKILNAKLKSLGTSTQVFSDEVKEQLANVFDYSSVMTQIVNQLRLDLEDYEKPKLRFLDSISLPAFGSYEQILDGDVRGGDVVLETIRNVAYPYDNFSLFTTAIILESKLEDVQDLTVLINILTYSKKDEPVKPKKKFKLFSKKQEEELEENFPKYNFILAPELTLDFFESYFKYNTNIVTKIVDELVEGDAKEALLRTSPYTFLKNFIDSMPQDRIKLLYPDL